MRRLRLPIRSPSALQAAGPSKQRIAGTGAASWAHAQFACAPEPVAVAPIVRWTLPASQIQVLGLHSDRDKPQVKQNTTFGTTPTSLQRGQVQRRDQRNLQGDMRGPPSRPDGWPEMQWRV